MIYVHIWIHLQVWMHYINYIYLNMHVYIYTYVYIHICICKISLNVVNIESWSKGNRWISEWWVWCLPFYAFWISNHPVSKKVKIRKVSKYNESVDDGIFMTDFRTEWANFLISLENIIEWKCFLWVVTTCFLLHIFKNLCVIVIITLYYSYMCLFLSLLLKCASHNGIQIDTHRLLVHSLIDLITGKGFIQPFIFGAWSGQKHVSVHCASFKWPQNKLKM